MKIEPLLSLLSKTDTYLKSETHFPTSTHVLWQRAKVDRVYQSIQLFVLH